MTVAMANPEDWRVAVTTPTNGLFELTTPLELTDSPGVTLHVVSGVALNVVPSVSRA